jgi:josephin
MNIHHEKQSVSMHCGVHCINNLLGKERFSSDDFEQIAEKLCHPSSWWNPHKAWLGLGNYDVNVLEYALKESQNCVFRWHDNRQTFSSAALEQDCSELVLNQVCDGWVSWLVGARHWLAVRRIEGEWYNLDSLKKAPEQLDDLDQFVQEIIDGGGYCLVVEKDDEK